MERKELASKINSIKKLHMMQLTNLNTILTKHMAKWSEHCQSNGIVHAAKKGAQLVRLKQHT